jgi:hypothetical protein
VVIGLGAGPIVVLVGLILYSRWSARHHPERNERVRRTFRPSIGLGIAALTYYGYFVFNFDTTAKAASYAQSCGASLGQARTAEAALRLAADAPLAQVQSGQALAAWSAASDKLVGIVGNRPKCFDHSSPDGDVPTPRDLGAESARLGPVLQCVKSGTYPCSDDLLGTANPPQPVPGVGK